MNWYLFAGCAYIIAWFIYAVNDMERTKRIRGDSLLVRRAVNLMPLFIAMILMIPFILGYLAGASQCK